MSEVLDYRPVSAEARGLGRVFRQRVVEIDAAFQAALAPILDPLRARLRHHPKLRASQVADAERLYVRTIPAMFRIGGITGAKTRTAFAVTENRITSSWLYADDWNSPDHREHGLSVAKFVLAAKDGTLMTGWTSIAAVSPHAIARWHERSGRRDHAALVRDLAVLADPTETEATPTPSGGRWLGRWSRRRTAMVAPSVFTIVGHS
jgi:hypothetical protein